MRVWGRDGRGYEKEAQSTPSPEARLGGIVVAIVGEFEETAGW